MNSTWSFYDLATGLFSGARYSGSSHTLADQLAHKGPGVGVHEGSVDYLTQRLDLDTDLLIEYIPPSPAGDTLQSWTWDPVTKSWLSTATLLAVQNLTWSTIKAYRDNLESGNFTFNGHVFQINKVNMAGAALDGLIAKTNGELTWVQPWKLFDNTTVIFTADEMIAVARSGVTYIRNIHIISSLLYSRIYSPSMTIDELKTITWPK